MAPEINQYELGKIVSSIDSLSRDVIKLETKIDVYLKDTISRREFDDLKRVVETCSIAHDNNIGRREFETLKTDVNNIGSLVKKINDDINRNQWIPRLAWIIIGAVVTGGIGLIFLA